MKNTSITLKINAWVLVVALLVTNLATLAWWRPWGAAASTAKRTIQMTGQASMQATPDQYNFYPYFEVQGSSSTDTSKKLAQKTTDVATKLKELGVKEDQIKTTQNNTTTYSAPELMSMPVQSPQSSVSFTIKVTDKSVAQKIQDYLQSSDAKGTVTPQADFADATRKKYEAELRDKALADAKDKAGQSAKALGASLGKVVTILDNQSGLVYPMTKEGVTDAVAPSSVSTILVGQNELSYNVQVTYALR